MTDVVEHFRDLEDQVNGELVGRHEEIHTAVLALISGKHHFQLGPPGTAKSLLVTRIAQRIGGLSDEAYFHWLLTKHTTPDELFGPPNIPLLKDHGVFKRNTERKMPRAKIVFLDEIFKGNSSILNSLLTIMNERKFFNHDDDPHVDLWTVFSASNELPSGEELNALWDRLPFRHVVTETKDKSTFVQMLTSTFEPQPKPVIDYEDILLAKEQANKVVINSEIEEALADLWGKMREDGMSASDRRWRESKGAIQAEAYLNGRTEAEIRDMRPLMHILWESENNIKPVTRHVLDLANPIDKEAHIIIDLIAEQAKQLVSIVEDADDPKQTKKRSVEVFQKTSKIKKKLLELRKQAKDQDRESVFLEQAMVDFKKHVNTLMSGGFKIDKDDQEASITAAGLGSDEVTAEAETTE